MVILDYWVGCKSVGSFPYKREEGDLRQTKKWRLRHIEERAM